MSFDLVADDTIDLLEKVVGGSARVLGCSDGAIVGPDNHPVTQERHRPDDFEIGPVNLSTRRFF